MSMCTILMTDKPLPIEMPISITINGNKKTIVFGKDGAWNFSYYEEGRGIDDYVCIDDLKSYVPQHWYGSLYLRTSYYDSDEELEYQYCFIRELIKTGIAVWYLKTWYGDKINKEDMVIKEIDVSDLHFIDGRIKSELPEYEMNVFYRFVLK